jgi:hypothetical protein
MTRTTVVAAGVLLALAAGGHAQSPELQQKIAAAKQASAQNQQALRTYSWIEKTDVVFKGEVKSTKLSSCRYGPDGKLQKQPVSASPEPEKKRGLRGRVIEKKTGEIKEEMGDAVALVHQYLPPDPARIQAALAAQKVTVVPGPTTAVRIADYLKPGDALTLTLRPGQGIQKVDVSSYLETPAEAVTLSVQMQSLPDGTDYPGAIALAVPSSNVEVRIANSNYQKLAP